MENLYVFFMLFAIYAFLGWCTEIAYATLAEGRFVNRGFLNGPVCPIYGFGVITVVLCLTPIKNNIPLLFLGSVLLTSALEFITGFILEKIFHDKWWDYSEFPFNIKGYICLKFSILWGLACVFVIVIIHPTITALVSAIPITLGIVLADIAFGLLLTDLIVTIASIIHLKKKLRIMNDITDRMKALSNKLGENIADTVFDAMEFKDKHKEDIEDLKARYKELLEQKSIIQKRLSHAFPELKKILHKKVG